MTKMSHRRFRNILTNMQDCFNAMAAAVITEEPMELSSDEQQAFRRMYAMMADMQQMMEQVTEMEKAAADRD